MDYLLKAIFNFIIFFFVPAILLTAIWLVRTMSKRLDDDRHRTSARAGFWAGVLLFVMFLVYEVGSFLATGIPRRGLYQGFSFWLALSGAIAGLIVFSGGKKVIPPKLSGVIVLVITFLSLYALLHYIFIRTYNDILLSLILGVTFGILAHFAVSPATLRDFIAGR